jgi:hypothetical protein
MSRTKSEMLSILLEELAFTDTDLAHLCEVPHATVQGWFSGAEPIPMAVIRMCGLLELVRRNDMLPDCWPGDWSPPPAAIGQTIRRHRHGQQPGAAAVALEAEALSKETRTTDPTLQRLIYLERQVVCNQRAFDFLIECLGPKILELMGDFDLATALPDELDMATALARGRKHASAKAAVPPQAAPPPQVTQPEQVYRRRRVSDQAVAPPPPPPQAAAPPQVTAPPPPPPRPEYREGLRLISAGLPTTSPPTAATSPFGSSEPFIRRRRRIAPPDEMS